MNLKHTVKNNPIYEVDYHDFGEYVEKHLGFHYDFVNENEVGNDSTTPVECPDVVDGITKTMAEELIKDTEEKVTWRPASTVMAALRLKGLVEPGTYLINVCW